MFDLTSRRLLQLVVPTLAALVAAALLVVCVAIHWWSNNTLARASAAEVAIQTTLDDRSTAPAPACAAEVNYAQGLPATLSPDVLAKSLQAAAQAFGSTLVSVSAEPRPATAKSLATVSVNIALRGAYPAIRSTLSEGLSRFPSGVLQQIHIRRSGSTAPPVEDATLQIVFALRPVSSGLAECSASPVVGAAMEAIWG